MTQSSDPAAAPDVYLYGMTVASTILRLAGAFPALDTYGEVAGTWQVPGGETMNAAMVLGRLGLRTRIGGPWLGSHSAGVIRPYAQRHGVDLSRVTEVADWEGVRDVVLVDDDHRTVLGWFGRYFSDPVHRWDPPDAASCAAAGVACIDPWFGADSDLAARYCQAAGTPYVTIDCAPDSPLAMGAAANVISGEYRRSHHPGEDEATLLARYRQHSAGLVVFSAGSSAIRFGRGEGLIREQPPFPVTAVSTLGAGDVFRAGIAWGLFHRLEDAATVRFAAGLAALCCTRMPIADTAPGLAEVEAFVAAGGRA